MTCYGPLAEAASTIPSMSLVPSSVNEMVHRVPRQQASTPRNSGIISFQTSGSTYPRGFGLYYDEADVLRWLDGSPDYFFPFNTVNWVLPPFSIVNSPGNENNGSNSFLDSPGTSVERHATLIVAIFSTMMSFVIFVLLFNYSNACLPMPDMDLPPVETTTEPGQLQMAFPNFLSTMNVEWAYNSTWSRFFGKYRYDGVHIDTYNHIHVHIYIDVHINTYNHVHVHIDVHINTYNHVHVHIDVHNNYIQYHNRNYYYN
ncbi:hypothetical protein WR25_11537 [Diploscapter pachys]|uniref:Uncharacterized protein n=1 Tax=Diploscapter pachys TaxID=2018661 RepID=A0A2A2L6K8_9BILA|nr:hypothetical protein WR25_11537 [Diploscapter pachys]